MITTPEVLRKVADHIERVGWIQGDMFAGELFPDPASRPSLPCCALGAFIAASPSRCMSREHYSARYAFSEWLIDNDGQMSDSVVAWNDKPGQTAENVIATLRRAADEIEAAS